MVGLWLGLVPPLVPVLLRMFLPCIFNGDVFPQNEFNSHHMVAIPIWAHWFCCHHCRYRLIIPWLVSTDPWFRARDSQFHCNAQKCCTHYCSVFVCRGTLQLLCGGGDMVEAILMQCPPLPDSAPILLFPFHCDSCWDRLLGDHIPGTKRAQLVWTGLSDTTSCSGCESLPSMQAFGLKITCHVFFTCIVHHASDSHPIMECIVCVYILF